MHDGRRVGAAEWLWSDLVRRWCASEGRLKNRWQLRMWTVQPHLVDSFIKPISTLGDGSTGQAGSPIHRHTDEPLLHDSDTIRLWKWIDWVLKLGHWLDAQLTARLHCFGVLHCLSKRKVSENSRIKRDSRGGGSSRFSTGQLLTANGAVHFTHGAARCWN